MIDLRKYLPHAGWAIAIFLAGYLSADWDQQSKPQPIAPSQSEPPNTLDSRSQESAPVSGSFEHEKTATRIIFGQGYDQYPSSVFEDAPQPLDLRDDQRIFVTRLTEAYADPINFGGSLVITTFGCGTGCTSNFALDKSSGRALHIPLGGEDMQMLQLEFRENSSLIWAVWGDSFSGCKIQPWRLGSDGFFPVQPDQSIDCSEADQLRGLQ